jgi:hypothetical protein
VLFLKDGRLNVAASSSSRENPLGIGHFCNAHFEDSLHVRRYWNAPTGIAGFAEVDYKFAFHNGCGLEPAALLRPKCAVPIEILFAPLALSHFRFFAGVGVHPNSCLDSVSARAHFTAARKQW